MCKDIWLKIFSALGSAACKESTEPGNLLLMQMFSEQIHAIEGVGTSIVEFHLTEDFLKNHAIIMNQEAFEQHSQTHGVSLGVVLCKARS